jgi:hypothetical protein
VNENTAVVSTVSPGPPVIVVSGGWLSGIV